MQYKWLLSLGSAFLLSHIAWAQVTAPTSELPAVRNSVYTYVEQMPVFPGGQQAMFQTIGQNIHYPTEALRQRLEGRVFVQFVVSTSGSVQDVKVSKSVYPLLDAAAIQAVSSLPAFTPGKQVGRAVPVSFTLPITFRLPQNVEEILAARTAESSTVASATARFPNGPKALAAYLTSIPYPEHARTTQAEDRVFVQFQVSSSGKVEQVAAISPVATGKSKKITAATKTFNELLMKAAEQWVAAMPNWQPAVQNGQPVASVQTLPVQFYATAPAVIPQLAYAYAEKMPVFPDSRGEMGYLGHSVRYPVSALRSQTQGVVVLYYEVSEQGKVENVGVIRSVSPDLDTEARRVVEQFPSYTPAQENGQPVRVFYVIPVTFAIR